MDREAKLAAFKAFLVLHPGLVQSVRNGSRSWQEIYEEWYIFGPDDERWNENVKPSSQAGWIKMITEKAASLDEKQLAEWVDQCKEVMEFVSSALGSIQRKTESETKNESYLSYWR